MASLVGILGRLKINAKSLICDVDSNRVEQFHNSVAKAIGGKRINFSLCQSYATRCKFAVISHNTKRPHYEILKSKLNSCPTSRITTVEVNKYKRYLEKRSKEEPKAKRKKIFETTDNNYGENCEKPDMSEEELKIQAYLLYQKLNQERDDWVRIEKETKGQSDSPRWHQIRRIRLTASSFGKICRTRKKESYVKKVLN